MEAMEKEFILTAMFAIVWVILSVTMLATGVYGKKKGFEKSITAYVMLLLILFMWYLFGVATIVAFGIELTIKLI